MKRKPLFLACVSLLTFSLPSCEEKRYEEVVTNRVVLSRQEGVSHLFYITELQELFALTRNKDVLLFVTKVGCSYCHQERNYLERYIEENSVVIYEVDIGLYLDAYEDVSNKDGNYKNNFPALNATPTYLFYKDGKYDRKIIGRLAYDSLDTYDHFKNFFEGQIYPINLYLLNDFDTQTLNKTEYHFFKRNDEDETTNDLSLYSFTQENLDKQIAKKEKTILYFGWRECSDCYAFNKNVFRDFLINHPDVNFYYYECDSYYQLRHNSNKEYQKIGNERWAVFSKKYHLYTDDFYHEIDTLRFGVVPTISTFENNKWISNNIYLNQHGIIFNEDDTLSMQFTFYPEEKKMKSKTKVTNKDTSSDAYFKAISELKEQYLKFDNEKVKHYLEEVIK